MIPAPPSRHRLPEWAHNNRYINRKDSEMQAKFYFFLRICEKLRKACEKLRRAAGDWQEFAPKIKSNRFHFHKKQYII